MALDEAGDGGDQLGQAGAQGDHGQADDRIGDAEGGGDQGAVVHQEAGAQGDGRGADHQQKQLQGEGPLFPVCLLFPALFRELRMPLHLQDGDEHIDHKDREIGKAHPALEAAQRPGDAGIGERRGEEEGRREGEGLGIDLPGTHGDGDRRDQAGVADDGADGVAVADAGVALHGRLAGDHHLRERGADGDDRRADQQLRQMKAAGDAHRAVDKPVAALDEQGEAEQKQ